MILKADSAYLEFQTHISR